MTGGLRVAGRLVIRLETEFQFIMRPILDMKRVGWRLTVIDPLTGANTTGGPVQAETFCNVGATDNGVHHAMPAIVDGAT